MPLLSKMIAYFFRRSGSSRDVEMAEGADEGGAYREVMDNLERLVNWKTHLLAESKKRIHYLHESLRVLRESDLEKVGFLVDAGYNPITGKKERDAKGHEFRYAFVGAGGEVRSITNGSREKSLYASVLGEHYLSFVGAKYRGLFDNIGQAGRTVSKLPVSVKYNGEPRHVNLRNVDVIPYGSGVVVRFRTLGRFEALVENMGKFRLDLKISETIARARRLTDSSLKPA